MAKAIQPKGRLVTSEVPFFPQGVDQSLFAVRGGVPAREALENAACFLGTACEVAKGDLSEKADSAEFWAMVYSMDLAKAVLDSVIRTMLDEAAALHQLGATQ